MNNSKFIYLFAFCILTFAFLTAPVAAQEEATPATQTIREKVREKIENIVHKPRAVVGTLTEITDSTLQIQTRSGQLQMAATGEETTYVRTTRGRRTEVEFEDLVLGDFIIAMGFRNGNEVLETRRVITYDSSPLTERRAVFGVVQGNENGTLTLQHPKTAEVWTVETSRDTKITRKGEDGFEEIDVDEVQVGDRIIAAGVPDEKEENTLLAGRIHVIPGRAEGQQ